MKTGRLALIAIIISIVVFAVVPLATNPTKQRALSRVMLRQIGEKILRHVESTTNLPPRVLSDYYSNGILTSREWEFLQDKRISYFPPGTNRSSSDVLLRWVFQDSAAYCFRMDGELERILTK